MPEYEYTFEIEETIVKRCRIVVEAECLQAAMDDVSVEGVWEWDICYGKVLDYESEELDNDPQDPANWEALDE